MKWILVAGLVCVIGYGGMSTYFLWRYLSWIRARRQYYLEHGNRKRKR